VRRRAERVRPRAWPVAAALLAAIALVGLAVAQGALRGNPAAGGYGPEMVGNGFGDHGGRGRGMPGGYGMMAGYGMMGGYGMMVGTGMLQVLPADAAPLDDDAVRAALRRAADTLVQGAQLHDIMIFTNNVYAQVLDAKGSAIGEILLDRFTGTVSPEPGPNMMWNTRSPMAGYGTMGGGARGAGPMAGSGGSTGPGATAAPLRFDATSAKAQANSFLARYLPGARVVGSQTFPGYFTFDYGTDGTPQGMLSVNAATGQIWPHSWHGAFIREME